MRLLYIAGHGAGDPGACNPNGTTEADMVRRLGTRIKQLGGDAVTLGDYTRNYYEDNGFLYLSVPADTLVIEGHMDAGIATARGAHVIIDGGLEPDEYDRALADNLADILPGRANKIVKREDLYNPYVCKARGINYRLVEFGFITSDEDLDIVDKHMDEIALAVLAACGIAQEIGGDDMLCYIQRKGTATQYLTDGISAIKGVPDLDAKASMTALIKADTGKAPKTHVLEPAAFDHIKKIVGGKSL